MCMGLSMHIPIRDNFVSTQAHATAQHALDIIAALRKTVLTKLCKVNDEIMQMLLHKGQER